MSGGGTTQAVVTRFFGNNLIRNKNNIFRRRPILTGTCVSGSLFVSYLYYTEYQAEQNVQKWSNIISSSSAHHQNQHEQEDGGSTGSNINQQQPNNSQQLGSLLLSSLPNSFITTDTTQQQQYLLSHPPPTLPRVYNWDEIYHYWSIRPVASIKRLVEIISVLSPILFEYLFDFVIVPTITPVSASSTTPPEQSVANEKKQRHLACKLRDALTNLGPAFVKAGQQLSIRPDLVPASVLKELQLLCDSVKPIDDSIALQLIRNELSDHENQLFIDTPVLVASASLGQVYKAVLKSNLEPVAIKVQRPGMLQSFSLDIFLLQHIGIVVDMFTSIFTNQPPFHRALYESFAQGSYCELDYENEAMNQKEFQCELYERHCPVIIPDVYDDLTTRYVLTSQWIEGKKLSDAPPDQLRQLIPVGVELFLTQLLDLGKFHSDPHPGNLLVNEKGQLCLLDFGLCATVDERARNALTKAIVHLITRDYDTLIGTDAKELGFLPDDYDTTELKPILTKILTVGLIDSGSDLRKRKRKLKEISSELNEIFFRYPFSVPPFFALVTRGLGLLEGIALTGDPDFDIFRASAPYATRRALTLLGREESFRLLTRSRT